MEEEDGNLRSDTSLENVYVKFFNLTNRLIEIVWVNYSGLFERYTLLRRGEHTDTKTYKTHPWIAVDVKTKDSMEEEDGNLRSGSSLENVYVKFFNLTNRMIEIVWVNYSGLFERYTLLRRGEYIDINTYKTHPWIAVDVKTKDRMHLNNDYVYQPVPVREFREENGLKYPVISPERRLLVRITLPVYSLRYRTLLQLRDLLKKPEDADKLELPSLLIEDLRKVIALKDKVNVIVSSRP